MRIVGFVCSVFLKFLTISNTSFNLKPFFKNRTVVIIAHRLSTVKDANQIVVLEDGCIKEIGNHKALTAAKGSYYKLVKNQLELGA